MIRLQSATSLYFSSNAKVHDATTQASSLRAYDVEVNRW